MARRTSSTSEDSQKENRPKVRGETAKADKGATTRGKGKARQVIDEEDEDASNNHEEVDDEGEEDAEGDEENDEEQDASPKGRKRVRVNTDGDSRPAATQQDVKPKVERLRPQTLPRDDDGFNPGAIVRVQLKNFVTYDFVEFRPGPYLNMIFGPNGTGKSTIACAICLGLNFPPTVLGRATDLPAFVKIGRPSGYIEIELKGLPGKKNQVIRRMLRADSKTSTFTLNGQSASGKEINSRMAELNVQIGNLCTFLPQDKVSEFAQMSPQQLLRETQRAAGNANLTNWHDALITSGRELKGMLEGLNADRDQLRTMQERNANLERDVRRYEERRRLEKEIELLELVLPFREYMEAKEEYLESKIAQRTLHGEVKRLQRKNAPILARKRALEQQMSDKDKQREDKKKLTKERIQRLNKRKGDAEHLGTQEEDLKSRFENIKETERKRKKDIERVENSIAQIQNKLDNPPEIENLEELNEEIKKLTHQNNTIKNRLQDLQDKQRGVVNTESRERAVLQQHQTELRQLDDASHRKLEELLRWDRDSGDAVRWLRDNKHRFKMEVFEPPMLCCTVPDARFVDAVEACFGRSQFLSFVAQCEEDYRLLNQLLVDSPEGVGRKLRLNTWFRSQHGVPLAEPPLSPQEMRQLGFDGYALDYLRYPEGLKWFLTSNMSLHRTAIALNGARVDNARAMDFISRISPNGGGGGGSYIAGNVFNTVARSRYGKRLPQNQTRGFGRARNLVSSQVDPETKQRIDAAIADVQTRIRICKEELDGLTREEEGVREEHSQSKKRHEDVVARKAKVNSQQKALAKLQLDLQRENDKLNDLRNRPSAEQERAQVQRELASVVMKRRDVTKDFIRHSVAIMNEMEATTQLGLEYIQLHANKMAIEKMNNVQEQELQDAMEKYTLAHKRYETCKVDSQNKLRVAKEKLDSMPEDTRDKFQEMETSGEANARSADEIEVEIQAKRHQLDLSLHTNPGVVEQFKKRENEIKVLSETIAEKEKRTERVERQIKTARDNWQPALEELVASIGQRFSAAFDRLGCAGEVRIHEDEDYDKWAIEIYVKFRDTEKLQLLTGERQSGGERSLTTILYLMSLTEEARAPFSLVDEINQGMDQRAERAVHNSLVEVTCNAEYGQYFLITPKLLPDLNYAERMKVLCVNNGEWLPEEDGLGNMMNMIEGYVNFRAQRGRQTH